MSAIRVIKKYPNRRLYDTEISSYITIEDVRQLIVDGESFEVRDAKTGEDLTRQVLLQIITEHAPEELNVAESYLGNRYSSNLIVIQITLNTGRSIEAKKAFYRRVVDEVLRDW